MKIFNGFLACVFFLYMQTDSLAQSNINAQLDEAFDLQNQVDCLISFRQKADLSMAGKLKSKNDKAHFVYNALMQTSLESQARVVDYLVQNNISYSCFSIVNAISAKLTKSQAQRLLQFSEVKNIAFDPSISLENIEEHAATKNNANAEWGIQMINADSVWMMGYEGSGVVIGGQDTGYEWEHSVLKSKYRGFINDTMASHDHNWHDAIFEINPGHNDSIPDASANPCGLLVPFPCDDHNHGTHTMGTMVGSDSTNLIGVAPASKWIACRNMERGIGKPSTYLECFEWFLAPTDLENGNPRPDLSPDVINNSWSCPEDEGCNESNWDMMREAIRNLKAAGVVVVVSAGNDGRSGCATIAKAPSMFEESFSVGATQSNDTIADFSSRGPVVIDSSFRMKPDISAPGQSVRSSIRNNAFARFSGTSMAGPHVAGAVALIINANPELRGQVETIESILKQSAVPKIDSSECFGSSALESPNHVYGHGRLDVLKAVRLAMQTTNTDDLQPVKTTLHFIPNPASSIVYINLSTHPADADYTVQIYNSEGQLVDTLKSRNLHLDTSNYTDGIYYVRLIGKNDYAVGKLIIAH